jgi:hypothetical protein
MIFLIYTTNIYLFGILIKYIYLYLLKKPPTINIPKNAVIDKKGVKINIALTAHIPLAFLVSALSGQFLKR